MKVPDAIETEGGR
jgi:hypothetical protein